MTIKVKSALSRELKKIIQRCCQKILGVIDKYDASYRSPSSPGVAAFPEPAASTIPTRYYARARSQDDRSPEFFHGYSYPLTSNSVAKPKGVSVGSSHSPAPATSKAGPTLSQVKNHRLGATLHRPRTQQPHIPAQTYEKKPISWHDNYLKKNPDGQSTSIQYQPYMGRFRDSCRGTAFALSESSLPYQSRDSPAVSHSTLNRAGSAHIREFFARNDTFASSNFERSPIIPDALVRNQMKPLSQEDQINISTPLRRTRSSPQAGGEEMTNSAPSPCHWHRNTVMAADSGRLLQSHATTYWDQYGMVVDGSPQVSFQRHTTTYWDQNGMVVSESPRVPPSRESDEPFEYNRETWLELSRRERLKVRFRWWFLIVRNLPERYPKLWQSA